jgi:hypothetical protein
MTAHISEELPQLLTGEASRDVVMAAAAHLRHCDDCQQELVSAVVAHASLTSAHRFAPEIVTSSEERLVVSEGEALPFELPDLSSVFAQVRTESTTPTDRRPSTAPKLGRSSLGSRTGRYLVAAAAVVALGGTAAITYAATSGGGSHASQSALETVKLAAFDTNHDPSASGTATLRTGGTVTINADKLKNLTDKRYEVWLTNSTRTDMQPVGWIGADGKATLTVPEDLISRYSSIEVSVQPLDTASYAYSKVSVLRGTYST